MSDYNQYNNKKWWLSSKNDLKDDVFAHVKKVSTDQSYRSSDNLRYARLYGNMPINGLNAFSYSTQDQSIATSNKVTLNIIQSMIDTVVSKITKNKVRPQILTDGGDWSLKQKAKKLTKFVDGIFNSSDFYQKAALAFTDSCIFGTGAIKIFQSNGNVKAERVFIEELLVSDTESFYGEPRQMHQIKHIQKDVLKQMFPDKKILIDQANDYGNAFTEVSREDKSTDMIKVIESWHLPSGPKAKDGAHSICIENVTLLKEEYNKSFFPFVFFRWGVKPVGFYGSGLSEQLQGLQLEINKILRTIQVSMHLVSIPKLLVEASSKIVSSHLNNKIGGIIKYAGTPPSYSPLGSIPPELFNHLERLYGKAYEIAGVSQLSAQSSKPSGLDSGKALRTFNDIESERFMAVSQRYEKVFVDAANIMISLAKDIYANDKDFKVKAKGNGFIETIKWEEVDMEEDKFMLDVYPTNALSKDPAGRLQDVQDLLSAGFLDKESAIRLLDFPDLEGEMDLLTSDSRNLEKIIENMISKGEYFPPEPYQNLENSIRKVQQAYLMFRMQGAPEDKLDLLRRYMEDCQGLLARANPPAPELPPQAEQLPQEAPPEEMPTAPMDLQGLPE